MKNDLFVSVIGFHEKNITRYELPKYMMREKILIRLILSLFLYGMTYIGIFFVITTLNYIPQPNH